jgi:hypothetical protein
VVCFLCYAEGTPLSCHFGSSDILVFCLFLAFSSAECFVSPTSTKFSCNPFVSPTYAKTGGWGVSFFAFCFPFLSARHLSRPGRGVRRLSRSGRDGASFLFRLLFLATRHSPLNPSIPAPLATAALRVVPAPIFTTTSRIHVGAPTCVTLHTAKGKPKNRSKDRPLHKQTQAHRQECLCHQTQEKKNPRPTLRIKREGWGTRHCMLRRRDIDWWPGREA